MDENSVAGKMKFKTKNDSFDAGSTVTVHKAVPNTMSPRQSRPEKA